mmetsp:Transcript_29476/g.90362  ORF Transcript_29476/g.90362 Transcript_29476/m.90362 type:complete len:102 (+) Transcript_29476:40-345(+)|eukprot:scaffold174249_cov40-Tisochrysis_lutea.AAC.2
MQEVAGPGDEAEDVPLFATSVPPGGLTTGMQAIAALIDEDEVPAAMEDEDSRRSTRSRKRKADSLGSVQVHLALSSCEQMLQRQRTQPHTDKVAFRRRETG